MANIGSTSKQFTAFSILLLAEEGKLSLDDDVRDYIPELPDFGQTVTIRNILTHTSGYREFLNLLIMSGRRLDHGDWIDRSEIIDIVQRQPALQNDPGSEFNYNNTAFALAAAIVERVSGMDFPDFLAQNVFQPLGMTRSMVRPTPEYMVPGRAEGYTPGPGGVFLELGDLGGAVGAGGIYTTVGDLQKWIENYHDPKVGTPEINAGITTQSNHAGFDGSIAFRLAEAFFGDEMEPEEVEEEAPTFHRNEDGEVHALTLHQNGDHPANRLDDDESAAWEPGPEELAGFTGRYFGQEVETFYTVTLEEDHLVLKQRRLDDAEIIPGEADQFTAGAIQVSFERDRNGQVIAFYLANGRTRDVRFEKVR